jgi:hypothetical protein
MNEIQDKMNELAGKIDQLAAPMIAEAVKNLRIALQHAWQYQLSEQQARQVLQSAEISDEADVLRRAILSDQQASPSEMERWGKSLLQYLTADPELLPLVDQAVDDALHSSSKDFGLSALIVVGIVVVLLKWRPTTFQTGKDGVKITWKENDVSIVKDLVKAVAGVAAPDAGGTQE